MNNQNLTLSKIRRLFNLIIFGSIEFFLNNKFYKRKKVVYLFSSRFGHLLQNTEIFLRGIKNKNKYIFVPEDKIDNTDLLNIWSRKINIAPRYIGDFLRFVLKRDTIHLRSLVVPQNKTYLNSRVIKNISLKEDKKIFQKFYNKNYISITFRDKKYNLIKQNDRRDDNRDTNIYEIKKVIDYFNKKNYTFVKINKSFVKFNKDKFFDYGFEKKYNLDTAFSIMKKSKLHVASSTGVDIYCGLTDKNCVYINHSIGTSFATRFFIKPTFFIPINMFYKKDNQLVSLKKQIEYFQYIKKKSGNAMLNNKELNFFGVYYKTNVFDEIKNVILEQLNLEKNSFILSSKQKKINNIFWKIYPKVWKWYDNKEKKYISSSSNKYRGNMILSEYYIKKYNNYLYDK